MKTVTSNDHSVPSPTGTGSWPSTSRRMAAYRTGGCGPTSTPPTRTASASNAENAVWYGDVPAKRCVRVREGGEVLQTIDLDRGCFACALGGADKRMLFLVAAEFSSAAGMAEKRTGQVLAVEAPAPGAGWP